MKKGQLPIAVVHALILIVYSFYYLSIGNGEFLIYIGVMLGLTLLVLISMKRVNYPNPLLWGLVFWSFLHMSGGGVPVGDGVLYEWMIWPISDKFPIFRFDQLVHMLGFGMTAYLSYILLAPMMKKRLSESFAFCLIILMAALGFGSVNEIVEFGASISIPENGVGGYINTSLDMVFNFIGALAAVIILYFLDLKGKF